MERINDALLAEWKGEGSIHLSGGSNPDGSWSPFGARGCSAEVDDEIRQFNRLVEQSHARGARWEFIAVDSIPEGVPDDAGMPLSTSIAPRIVDITIELL